VSSKPIFLKKYLVWLVKKLPANRPIQWRGEQTDSRQARVAGSVMPISVLKS